MKKIPMFLLTLLPYGIVTAFWLLLKLSNEQDTSFNTPLVMLIMLVAFCFFAMPLALYAFVLPLLKHPGRKILFWNMFLKLWNIPIFVVVFILGVGLSIWVFFLLPLLAAFDYALLLSSTTYGISGLLCMAKDGKFSKPMVVLNIILQFIFCLDVFSAIYCYVKAVLITRKDRLAAEKAVK